MDNDIQDILNNAPIQAQLNINNHSGGISFSGKSRFAKKFEKLKEEVAKDLRYNSFKDDFLRYNTALDGRSMPDKLRDGGFLENHIKKATERKHYYSKKLEKNQLYETAQLIEIELFAMVTLNFETYIEPLVQSGAEKSIIMISLNQNVVTPVYQFINLEGQDDTILNYSVEDILGMVYFLTGKCHLNWANYGSIQSSI